MTICIRGHYRLFGQFDKQHNHHESGVCYKNIEKRARTEHQRLLIRVASGLKMPLKTAPFAVAFATARGITPINSELVSIFG
jgi:hypothetical protein